MREIRTSGLMSGEGKRTAHAAPRLSSTLLVLGFFLRVNENLTRIALAVPCERKLVPGAASGLAA